MRPSIGGSTFRDGLASLWRHSKDCRPTNGFYIKLSVKAKTKFLRKTRLWDGNLSGCAIVSAGRTNCI